jgi:hypothetical protein
VICYAHRSELKARGIRVTKALEIQAAICMIVTHDVHHDYCLCDKKQFRKKLRFDYPINNVVIATKLLLKSVIRQCQKNLL